MAFTERNDRAELGDAIPADPMLVQGWPVSQMRVESNGRQLSQAEKIARLIPSVGGRYELNIAGLPNAKAARVSDPFWPDVGWRALPQMPGVEVKDGVGIRLAGGRAPVTVADKQAPVIAAMILEGTIRSPTEAYAPGGIFAPGVNITSQGPAALTAAQVQQAQATQAAALKTLSTPAPVTKPPAPTTPVQTMPTIATPAAVKPATPAVVVKTTAAPAAAAKPAAVIVTNASGTPAVLKTASSAKGPNWLLWGGLAVGAWFLFGRK